MSAFSLRSIKNIWGQGDEADYEPEHHEAPDTADEPSYRSDSYRSEKYTSSPSSSYTSDYSSGSTGNSGSSGAARRLRPVAVPLRAREKNIYTLKPKSQEEAS